MASIAVHLLATVSLLQTPESTSVGLTYLANEGVMLASSRGRVLIDALFGDGLPDYAVVPRPARDSLERAMGPYGGPAIVLTTHAHRDHYDSAAVARYLASNSAAAAIGPPGTPGGNLSPADLGWVRVRPIPIPHGPTRRPVGHRWYLVTLDGVTALHLGDTNGDPASWRGLGLRRDGVDIALVPYWFALDDDQFRRLLEVVPARTVVLIHISRGAWEGGGGWPERLRQLRARYPQVRAPRWYGEAIDLAR